MFVGSSHVAHLKSILVDKKQSKLLPIKVCDFLSQSAFVGCEGLKIWSADEELNGIFNSRKKAWKYGNLWEDYSHTEVFPDWCIAMVGGNHCDDFFGHTLNYVITHVRAYYEKNLNDFMQQWLNELSPHIVSFFRTLELKCPLARLGFIAILPRPWWCNATKELARRIDHFIEFNLRVDYKLKVKLIRLKSLCYYDHRAVDSEDGSTVLPGMLERDLTHLNFWGYRALVNKVAIPVMDQIGAMIGYRSANYPGRIRKSILRKYRYNPYRKTTRNVNNLVKLT